MYLALQSKDFKDLYIAFEAALRKFNLNKSKAEKKIIAMGWASASEIKRFRETANKQYRHYSRDGERPETGMTAGEANDLIRGLFRYLVVYLIEQRSAAVSNVG